MDFSSCKNWAFTEAKQLIKTLEKNNSLDKKVVFEMGYGPSGLPHIGTFCEAFRTTMVRFAFHKLLDTDISTSKLICFSDDKDGFRKVPTNLPNQDMLLRNLGKSLTAVPDPFAQFSSLGEYNNNKLKQFLDQYAFDYEFLSATKCYADGLFNEELKKVLVNYDKILKVILPTLRQERKQTYSPFMPVCPNTNQVLQVGITDVDIQSNTISYLDINGEKVTTSILDGHCKLQWKVDWGMRWSTLAVDYEMSGKDLADSVKIASKVCKIIGNTAPIGLSYEMFLDHNGQKISKSKGNGLSMEDWLAYAPQESLTYYLFQHPKRAKRLYFDVIPKSVDEYLQQVKSYHSNANFDNPVYCTHQGVVPDHSLPCSFSLLLNLASACNAEDEAVMWGFVKKYTADAVNNKYLAKVIPLTVKYYQNIVKPNKKYKTPSKKEFLALDALKQALSNLKNSQTDSEQIQAEIYRIGREFSFDPMRDWFTALYQVLLGTSQGPRFGSFIALYGVDNTIRLIEKQNTT